MATVSTNVPSLKNAEKRNTRKMVKSSTNTIDSETSESLAPSQTPSPPDSPSLTRQMQESNGEVIPCACCSNASTVQAERGLCEECNIYYKNAVKTFRRRCRINNMEFDVEKHFSNWLGTRQKKISQGRKCRHCRKGNQFKYASQTKCDDCLQKNAYRLAQKRGKQITFEEFKADSYRRQSFPRRGGLEAGSDSASVSEEKPKLGNKIRKQKNADDYDDESDMEDNYGHGYLPTTASHEDLTAEKRYVMYNQAHLHNDGKRLENPSSAPVLTGYAYYDTPPESRANSRNDYSPYVNRANDPSQYNNGVYNDFTPAGSPAPYQPGQNRDYHHSFPRNDPYHQQAQPQQQAGYYENQERQFSYTPQPPRSNMNRPLTSIRPRTASPIFKNKYRSKTKMNQNHKYHGNNNNHHFTDMHGNNGNNQSDNAADEDDEEGDYELDRPKRRYDELNRVDNCNEEVMVAPSSSSSSSSIAGTNNNNENNRDTSAYYSRNYNYDQPDRSYAQGRSPYVGQTPEYHHQQQQQQHSQHPGHMYPYGDGPQQHRHRNRHGGDYHKSNMTMSSDDEEEMNYVTDQSHRFPNINNGNNNNNNNSSNSGYSNGYYHYEAQEHVPTAQRQHKASYLLPYERDQHGQRFSTATAAADAALSSAHGSPQQPPKNVITFSSNYYEVEKNTGGQKNTTTVVESEDHDNDNDNDNDGRSDSKKKKQKKNNSNNSNSNIKNNLQIKGTKGNTIPESPKRFKENDGQSSRPSVVINNDNDNNNNNTSNKSNNNSTNGPPTKKKSKTITIEKQKQQQSRRKMAPLSNFIEYKAPPSTNTAVSSTATNTPKSAATVASAAATDNVESNTSNNNGNIDHTMDNDVLPDAVVNKGVEFQPEPAPHQHHNRYHQNFDKLQDSMEASSATFNARDYPSTYRHSHQYHYGNKQPQHHTSRGNPRTEYDRPCNHGHPTTTADQQMKLYVSSLITLPDKSMSESELDGYCNASADKLLVSGPDSLRYALFCLMKSNYNISRALDEIALSSPEFVAIGWSPKEVLSFETLFPKHGENFLLYKEMIPSKSLDEIKEFHRIWQQSKQSSAQQPRQQQQQQHSHSQVEGSGHDYHNGKMDLIEELPHEQMQEKDSERMNHHKANGNDNNNNINNNNNNGNNGSNLTFVNNTEITFVNESHKQPRVYKTGPKDGTYNSYLSFNSEPQPQPNLTSAANSDIDPSSIVTATTATTAMGSSSTVTHSKCKTTGSRKSKKNKSSTATTTTTTQTITPPSTTTTTPLLGSLDKGYDHNSQSQSSSSPSSPSLSSSTTPPSTPPVTTIQEKTLRTKKSSSSSSSILNTVPQTIKADDNGDSSNNNSNDDNSNKTFGATSKSIESDSNNSNENSSLSNTEKKTEELNGKRKKKSTVLSSSTTTIPNGVPGEKKEKKKRKSSKTVSGDKLHDSLDADNNVVADDEEEDDNTDVEGEVIAAQR